MNITLNLSGEKQYFVQIHDTTTFLDLKTTIYQKSGLQFDKYWIIYKGKN